jgi:flagellar motor switch protein FliM
MRHMNLDTIRFEVTVLLGKTTIPLKAYMGLQVGDVLILDQSIEKGLVTRVGSEKRYLATAGLFETHKAITIDERIYP